MNADYKFTRTSPKTAYVEDVVIEETSTTRKVARFHMHENPQDPAACIKVTLVHQRQKATDKWIDVETEPLSALKAGESAKMPLSSAATLKLFKAGADLFRVHSRLGVPWGADKEIAVAPAEEIVRVDGNRAEFIRQLLEQGYSEDVWRQLSTADPDLTKKLSLARIQEERLKSLSEFKRLLSGDTSEDDWEEFFETNTWIFGYGLKYVFIRALQVQPHYGGTDATGSGGSRGDFLCGTVSFGYGVTVLVEIKKSTTTLLGREYRNSAYPLSRDVTGAISQLQANARLWEVEGAGTEKNREIFNELTVSPRAILVVGHSEELDTADKKRAFNLHRAHLTNPEILTYDELLNRARFIVEEGSRD